MFLERNQLSLRLPLGSEKNLISVPNSKINFFKLLNTNSPLLSSYQKTGKCKANSISFPVNTMQCNKAVDSTSNKNSVSDTRKFQSFLYLYNVDNKDKSLPLLLSTTSKAFQCKETGVRVITDNGQKNKSNSCEKKTLLFSPNLHQICLQTFSLNQYKIKAKEM